MTTDEKESMLVEIFSQIRTLKKSINAHEKQLSDSYSERFLVEERVNRLKKVYNENIMVVSGLARHNDKYLAIMRPVEIRELISERRSRTEPTKMGDIDEESVRYYSLTVGNLNDDLDQALKLAEEVELQMDEENKAYEAACEELYLIKQKIKLLKRSLSTDCKELKKWEHLRVKVDKKKCDDEPKKALRP